MERHSTSGIDYKKFNRDFLIKYYPNPSQRWRSKLVTLQGMERIIDDPEVFESKLDKIMGMVDNEMTIRLRRAVEFKIIYR